MNTEDLFDQSLVDESDMDIDGYDSSFELSYKIFLGCFDDQFQNAMKVDAKLFSPVTFRSKSFQQYVERFNYQHQDSLSTRSTLVRELYILHMTSRAMYRYNEEVLGLSHIQFRSHFYFPNVIYLLIRYLHEVRGFLQKTIRSAYYSIQKKNSRMIHLYENSIYTDNDVIRTDILYSFLGNSIKKINPYEIKNIKAFYRQVFLNHFYYYFKAEQKIHSQVIDEITLDNVSAGEPKSAPTREGLYRDVLTNLQVESYRDVSPTMRQLHYNYNIFKNVIITNEFQSVFLTSQPGQENTIFCNLSNSQYKVLSFYEKIMTDEQFLMELKKLPLIYRLLKGVHLVTRTAKSRLSTIRTEVLISAVADELAIPFRNLLNSDISIRNILLKIAENFVSSILVGEYISLQTLAPIKLDHLSFVNQLRKFIRLCVSNNVRRIL